MKEFRLPDPGEGLVEADIVRWVVAEGDEADFAAGGDEGEGQAGFVFRAHGVTRWRAARG